MCKNCVTWASKHGCHRAKKIEESFARNGAKSMDNWRTYCKREKGGNGGIICFEGSVRYLLGVALFKNIFVLIFDLGSGTKS